MTVTDLRDVYRGVKLRKGETVPAVWKPAMRACHAADWAGMLADYRYHDKTVSVTAVDGTVTIYKAPADVLAAFLEPAERWMERRAELAASFETRPATKVERAYWSDKAHKAGEELPVMTTTRRDARGRILPKPRLVKVEPWREPVDTSPIDKAADPYAGAVISPPDGAVRIGPREWAMQTEPAATEPVEPVPSADHTWDAGPLGDYLRRLVYPAKLAYAVAYVAHVVDGGPEPDDPGTGWAESVRGKVAHYTAV